MSFWPNTLAWPTMPLKYACRMNPDALSENTSTEFELEYIDISSVSLEEGVRERQLMTFGEAPSRARKKLENGDTIISTVRTYLKAIAYVDGSQPNWIASTGFAVLRPLKNIVYPRYLYRVA